VREVVSAYLGECIASVELAIEKGRNYVVLPLSDYQETAKAFLLEQGLFACLFDAPGVGKTAPTIVAAWEKHVETGLPVLVTCPAYLVDNWAWEISRFAPAGATVSLANGNGPAARREALQANTAFVIQSYANWSAKVPKPKAKAKEQYTPQDLESLDTYEAAQPKPPTGPRPGEFQYPELHTRQWAVCVFDEGHRLRGRNSNCTKHVFELRKARGANLETPIWALTGTPILNNPGDLFPLLHLWNKREFRSYWNFVGDFCRVTKTPWATEVGQLRKGMEDEFQELVGSFALRRTLADIPSLAGLEHIEKDYYVRLPASVNKSINKAREEYVLEHEDLEKAEFVSGGGALYSRLRMLATLPPTSEKPKVDFVRDFLEDKVGPVVVYCWYKDSARGVSEALTKGKRPVTVITGDVPTARRGELVDAWKRQPNGILVATISSLKEGISLIHAQDVIFLEHSELPADQDQCIARLKRRGQTELVRVHHVWARNTPDMAIKRHLDERTTGLKQALSSWLREPE
jgi:SNF2 family DNA or RNA helicase